MYTPSQFVECSIHRKSRLVGVVEELHRSVDDHCVERFGVIQSAKERRAYEIKQKARYAFHIPSGCFPSAPHISVGLHGYIHMWISTTTVYAYFPVLPHTPHPVSLYILHRQPKPPRPSDSHQRTVDGAMVASEPTLRLDLPTRRLDPQNRLMTRRMLMPQWRPYWMQQMHQAHQATYLGRCRAPRTHLWARRLPHHCDELRPR